MPRRLVTVREVSSIGPVARGQGKSIATVDGWRVVVPTGTFQVGQYVVFFEIDSFLPTSDKRFLILFGTRLTTFEGKEGFRVQTESPVPNVISQGLILPLTDFPEIRAALNARDDFYGRPATLKWIKDEACFEHLLGVIKFERACKDWKALGFFPSIIKKTDVSRAQNVRSLLQRWGHRTFQETTKMDGQSMTAFYVLKLHPAYEHLPPTNEENVFENGRFGVCSRNLELKEDRKSPLWQIAKRSALATKLSRLGRSIAVQGEVVGHGINMNREKFPENVQEFFVFGAWDIEKQRRVLPRDVEMLAQRLGLKHVPVVGYSVLRSVALTQGQLEARSAGTGHNGQKREGIVFKEVNGEYCFKVIDKNYLLEHDE